MSEKEVETKKAISSQRNNGMPTGVTVEEAIENWDLFPESVKARMAAEIRLRWPELAHRYFL